MSPAAATLITDELFHAEPSRVTRTRGRVRRPARDQYAAAALREADVPFLLGGGLAAWARGGPETVHDLDLMVRPEDGERGLKALEEAGFRPE